MPATPGQAGVDPVESPLTPGRTKKLKQMRLPFTRILATNPPSDPGPDQPATESPKKRKPSTEADQPPPKREKRRTSETRPPVTEPAATPPPRRRIAPTPVRSDTPPHEPAQSPPPAPTTEATPAEAAGTPVQDAPSVPPDSPAVIGDRQRRVQVAVARLTVQINELTETMDGAARDREFLQAATLKTRVDELTTRRQALAADLEQAGQDGAQLCELVSRLADTDSPSTPLITPQRALTATTPDSAGASPRLTSEAKRAAGPKKKEVQRRAREQLREERQLAKARLKLEKDQLRQAKDEQKEEEKRQKEEEKRQKEQEKRQKEVERQQREETRKLKEEAKVAELLAKQKKEAEKRKQDEAEQQKIQKTVHNFTSFFIKKTTSPPPVPAETRTKIVPEHLNLFRVKKDMRLAPVSRRVLDSADAQRMRDVLNVGLQPEQLYLACLKRPTITVGRSGRTWPLNDRKKMENDDDEVEILEDDDEEEEEDVDMGDGANKSDDEEANALSRVKVKPKLLQFNDNLRPAYWGTWSKKSLVVRPRRPFAQDPVLLDYEYDSGDDWEEEEPGESLSDEENDKEEDEDEDMPDDEDDGFFVGHGVLDKDEIHMEEEEDEDQAGEPSGQPLDPNRMSGVSFDEEWETKKQKLREQEFEKEYYSKKKPTKLKPRVFGCMWLGESQNGVAYEQLLKILKPFEAVTLGPSPIPTSLSSPKPPPSEPSTPSAKIEGDTPTSQRGPKKSVFPDDAYPDLVRLVHSNTNGKYFLAKEFSEYWAKRSQTPKDTPPEGAPGSTPAKVQCTNGEISKRKILETIAEIAVYKKFPDPGPMQNRMCWVVKNETLDKFELTSLPIPNEWTYILEQPNKFELPKTTPKPAPGTTTPGRETGTKQSSIQSNFFILTPKRKPSSRRPASEHAEKVIGQVEKVIEQTEKVSEEPQKNGSVDS